MTSGKEILTIQLGHYANFVGSHWWNIQEMGFDYTGASVSDINHDVLYREGKTDKGYVTFTPRLLLVDLKGSLRHLPEQGDLYEEVPDSSNVNVLWPKEKVDVIQAPKPEKNEFLEDLSKEHMEPEEIPLKIYDLDNEVNVWSDFLRTRYHPRTTTVINKYQHGNSAQTFDVYNYGLSLWKTHDFEEEFTDKIRQFVEECDSMQGFQIIADSTDGFSGLCSGLLEHLADEYRGKSSLTFPTIRSTYPGSTPLQDSIRTVNILLGFTSWAEHSSLLVPLSTASSGWRTVGPPRHFPLLQYNADLLYHSSSLIATALETLTLPWRLRTPPSSLGDMCSGLSCVGRTFAAASLSLPFSLKEDAFLLDTLENWDGPLWESLTPSCPLQEDRIWIQSLTLRGVPATKLKRSNGDPRSPAYSCSSVQEMLSLFLSCCSYATASQVTTSEKPLAVTSPFPQFFSKMVTPNGSLSTKERPPETCVHSVPALAGLHSTKGVGTMLESLHTEASRLHMTRMHQFRSSGLEDDEYNECLSALLELRDCYREEFDV
ncbi:protein misato [Schistocerca piceifrons]|uniref:protein misato n=1 Tax=Schistocerca piceifrons TaxID=274613 RepID=UPI001F5FE8DE|nr:protein misato [Schistocerca piceifrons]